MLKGFREDQTKKKKLVFRCYSIIAVSRWSVQNKGDHAGKSTKVIPALVKM